MTLNDYMAKHRLTNAAFGRMVGMDQSSIWRIATGERLPSLEAAFVINYVTKGQVPLDSFLLMSPREYHKAFLKVDRRDADGRRLEDRPPRSSVIAEAVSQKKAKRAAKQVEAA
jgi:hypothetical protein